MSSRRRRVVEAVVLVTALGWSTLAMGFDPAGQGPPLVPWLDTSDRETVARAHEVAFAAAVPELGWSGSDNGCDPGTSSARFRAATLDRVNYYRAMAGVMATVSEDAGLSAKAQHAAMMMSAEGELTHTPAETYACYTPVGREAAANSNLYLGRNGPAAIDGYIEDPGDDNADVGHRNTILHPPTRKMGVGDVDRSPEGYTANALWVFDQRVFDEGVEGRRPAMRETERFVAWPPRGYVPAPLVHPRWSFTLAGADLSQAEVSMFDLAAPEGEQVVVLEVVSRTGAPGHVPLPTIVWEPVVAPSDATDTDYLVVITGVRPESTILAAVDGEGVEPTIEPAYTYTVRVMGRTPNGRLTVNEALERFGR